MNLCLISDVNVGGYVGGPWHWPVECPPSLVEMVNSADYATFADYANSLFHWDATGWEAIVFGVMSVLLPPYADAFMVSLKYVVSILCL